MYKRWFWIILVILAILGTTAVGTQGGFTVLRDDYSYAFNRELVFELELRSDNEIPADSVELLYSIGHEGDVVNRRQPEYEPAKTLTLQVRDELDQGQIPPASTITYHWEITDAAGNILKTDEKSFVYLDDRFNWQSKTQGPITVYWYDRVDGERILSVAMDALERLESTISYEMEMPINIVVYGSKSDMQGAMAPRGKTFDEQVITLGTVVAPDVMLLLGSDSDVGNTIDHELTHMVVGAATENPFADIPAWLNEGLAMYNQGAVTPTYRDALRAAARSGDLDTVRRLSARTGNVTRVNLWYAEVWSLINFLISEYGEDKMAELLDIFSRGAHPDDALVEVYGFDRDGLTARWWKWLDAEVPPSLQGELGAESEGEAGPAGEEQDQAPKDRERPTQVPAAPESRSVQEPGRTAPLACCLGLLSLGLILFGGLRLRRRE